MSIIIDSIIIEIMNFYNIHRYASFSTSSILHVCPHI